jgi:heme/copper-type cytochrome/quinol oxidase subunit 2
MFESKGFQLGLVKMEYGGLFGLLVLAGDIWAIINILQSNGTNSSKLMWILLVVLLPVLGLIIWFLAGPRNRPQRL